MNRSTVPTRRLLDLAKHPRCRTCNKPKFIQSIRTLHTRPPAKTKKWPYPVGISLALLPGLFWFLSPGKPQLSPQLYSTQTVSSTVDLNGTHKLVSVSIPPDAQHFFTSPYKIDGTKALTDEIVVQHMMIGAPQIQIERPYTPINDPSTGTIEMVVKRVKGGEVPRLIHSLHEGQNIEMRGPIPTFSIRPDEYDDIVMISTGTGIAPFLQLMARLPQNGPQCHLVHMQPSGDDWIVSSGILRSYQDRIGEKLSIHRPTDSISAESIRPILRDVGKRIMVLVCLPPHMMRPICGGLTRNLGQGPLTGILADLGLTADQVWKLE